MDLAGYPDNLYCGTNDPVFSARNRVASFQDLPYGGSSGIGKNLAIVAHYMTRTLLQGWIVQVGMIIGFVWYRVLEFLGVRKLQQIQTSRAVLSVALPMIFGLIIILVIQILTNPNFFYNIDKNNLSSISRSLSSSKFWNFF